jgi:AraC-like DNA-binding protein
MTRQRCPRGGRILTIESADYELATDTVITSVRSAPALRHFVKYYYQVEETLTSTVALQPVPARSPEIIEFMFATHYIVERLHHGTMKDSWATTLVGSKTHRHVNLFMRDRVDAFTIAFQPGGCAALFGIPPRELTDQDFDARDVIGPQIHALRDRLGEYSSIADRARIADQFLCGRLADFNHDSPLVRTARVIHRCLGSVQIARLADSAGLGMRQFERRFAHEIGMTPKLYARIVRFESALRCKSASPDIRWTDIACSLGYFDQMHMIHDFKQLSDDTPTGIIDQLDMFVKPEVESRQSRP